MIRGVTPLLGVRAALVAVLAAVVGAALLVPDLAFAKKSDEAKNEELASKSAAVEEVEFESYYASTMGRSGRDYLVVQYWSKGDLLRAETTIGGHPIINIVDSEQYYVLDPSLGTGIQIRRSDEAIALDAKHARPFAREYEEILEAGGEKVRSEEIDGNVVDVYRSTSNLGRRTVWVEQNYLRLPLRVETFERSTGRTGRLDYVIWMPGIKLSDEFFEPPSNIELTRFESYDAYLERLREGPVPPAPPFFRTLLRPPD